jgi:hypothetical protein
MLPVLGPGALFIQRTDIANATPVNIGKANSFKLSQTFTKKELYGQNQMPLFIGRTTGKFTATAKAALISGIAFASVFYGMTMSAGQQATALSESGTIAAGAYATANHATFVADLGVIYASTGLPLTYVTGSPSAGQYTQTAGVYGFNTGDNGKAIFVTYTYTVSSSGQQMTISNPLIGTTPTFQAWYYTAVSQAGGAVPLNLQLYQCVADKLDTEFKLEDFMMPDFSFSCFANSANSVGLWSFGEVS